MRLLRTDTLEFVEFMRPPDKYAILSHRWGEAEVSYEDYEGFLRSPTRRSAARNKKIIDCCALAKSCGHRYVWIDTCCIDKRSSAELSESINSMWEWYSQATECFAFLTDVRWSSDRTRMMIDFERSEWFKRGWTLQELLAPRVVTFCVADWTLIGRKHDPDMLKRVSRITNVPESCLASGLMIHTKCVAERLSWAANRTTTRPEDSAYSLLGLMGVNMPLLYGEGSKAFLRLQQEIIRQVDDESIFAWRYVSPPRGFLSGLLAPDVSAFSNSHGVAIHPGFRSPIAITNKGLEIQSKATLVVSAGVYVLSLHCAYPVELAPGSAGGQTAKCTIAIRPSEGAWYRVSASRLGQHLETMYAGLETRELDKQTYYIKLSRWDNRYQPAIASLTKAMMAWRRRRPGAKIVGGVDLPDEEVKVHAMWQMLEQQNIERLETVRAEA